jgi:hypothetical protein
MESDLPVHTSLSSSQFPGAIPDYRKNDTSITFPDSVISTLFTSQRPQEWPSKNNPQKASFVIVAQSFNRLHYSMRYIPFRLCFTSFTLFLLLLFDIFFSFLSSPHPVQNHFDPTLQTCTLFHPNINIITTSLTPPSVQRKIYQQHKPFCTIVKLTKPLIIITHVVSSIHTRRHLTPISHENLREFYSNISGTNTNQGYEK